MTKTVKLYPLGAAHAAGASPIPRPNSVRAVAATPSPSTAPIARQPARPIELPYRAKRNFVTDMIARMGRLGPGQWPDIGFGRWGQVSSQTPPSISDIMGRYLGGTPQPDEMGGVAQELGIALRPTTVEEFVAGMRSLGFGGTTPEHWNYGIPMTTSWAGPGGVSQTAAEQAAYEFGRSVGFSIAETLATKAVAAATGNKGVTPAQMAGLEEFFEKMGTYRENAEVAQKLAETGIRQESSGSERGPDSRGDVSARNPWISEEMRRRIAAARMARAWAAMAAGPTISGGLPIDPAWAAQGSARGTATVVMRGDAVHGPRYAAGASKIQGQRSPGVRPRFGGLVGPGRVGAGDHEAEAAINDPFLPLYDPARRGGS